MRALAGWKTLPLIEVATLQRGYDLPMQDRIPGSVPILAATSEVGTHAYAKVSGPGVVTGRSGSIGNVQFVEQDYWPLNTTLYVKDFHGNEPRFIYYLLKQLRLERYHEGTGVPTLNRNNIHTIQVVIPPVPEQRRIAEVLDRAEALRAKRRTALEQLDGLPQAIFLEMFGSHQTILDRWPTQRLGNILDFLTSGSRGWAAHYVESGDLFLRIQNVRRDELLLDDVAFVRPPDTAEARRTRVEAGDVLLSITADLGRVAVVPPNLGPAFINQHLAILRTKGLVPQFLSAYLASPAGQVQVLGRNRQGVKAGLNFDDIRSLLVPSVPEDLQHAFASQSAIIERMKASQRASLAEMDALFASLQHRAFRGQLSESYAHLT